MDAAHLRRQVLLQNGCDVGPRGLSDGECAKSDLGCHGKAPPQAGWRCCRWASGPYSFSNSAYSSVSKKVQVPRLNSFATSTANLTAAAMSVSWLAPVPQPGTTLSVVIATPTVGAAVAIDGCKMLFKW